MLRIICILFIIANHYSFYGGWERFTAGNFSWQMLAVQVLHIGGTLAVNIFILITGYFSIEKEVSWRRYIQLVIETLFYSITIYGSLVLSGLISFSAKDFIKSCLPIVYGHWYIVYYLLFIPLTSTLNMLLNKLTNHQFKWLLVYWIIIWSAVPTILNGWRYGNLGLFFGMYIFGAYLRKFQVSEKRIIITGLISLLLLYISPVVLDYFSMYLGKEKFLPQTTYFDKNYSLLVVFASVGVFLIFKRKVRYNNAINYVAGSVIGIYLIHDNEYIRQLIWQTWWPNSVHITSNDILLHAFCKVAIIFMACLFIDIIRRSLLTRIEQRMALNIIEWIKKPLLR